MDYDANPLTAKVKYSYDEHIEYFIFSLFSKPAKTRITPTPLIRVKKASCMHSVRQEPFMGKCTRSAF